jgi:phosphoribosyl-dephospho-CoA transferase
VGGLGFALASGIENVVHCKSDLDLLVRMESMEEADIVRLHEATCDLGCVVDVQIEMSEGGLALGELLQGSPRVMLRTSEGVRLVSRDSLFQRSRAAVMA